VELIVLNIGRTAGVLDAKTYSIFLVMALVTTLMTVPLVNLVFPDQFHHYSDKALVKVKELVSERHKVVVCLNGIDTLVAMMRLTVLVRSGDVEVLALRIAEDVCIFLIIGARKFRFCNQHIQDICSIKSSLCGKLVLQS
jgi:hypothetical protein